MPIINSHKILCRGVNKYDIPLLEMNRANYVIVNVSDNSSTDVLCQYSRDSARMCGIEVGKEYRGHCPYHRG